MSKRFINWLRHPSDSSATAAILLLLVGGLIVVAGYDYLYSGVHLRRIVEDFYANASSELISIAITVLVIDQLNQRRARQQEADQKRIAQEAEEEAEKKRLILQMGSPFNEFAVEAARALEARGWLKDGSLQKAFLEGANLQGANLYKANLQGADLLVANLHEAFLLIANLHEANLARTNLQGANLIRANLQGANMRNANLQEADLRNTILDKTTILPNDSHYDPEKGQEQLECFTNPEHPNFWRPKPDRFGKYPKWYKPNDQT